MDDDAVVTAPSWPTGDMVRKVFAVLLGLGPLGIMGAVLVMICWGQEVAVEFRMNILAYPICLAIIALLVREQSKRWPTAITLTIGFLLGVPIISTANDHSCVRLGYPFFIINDALALLVPLILVAAILFFHGGRQYLRFTTVFTVIYCLPFPFFVVGLISAIAHHEAFPLPIPIVAHYIVAYYIALLTLLVLNWRVKA